MALPQDRLGVWINPLGTPAEPNPAPGFPDGGWVEITEFVRYRQGVTIRFGRPDEATRVDASVLTLSLDNSDGRFSPRNAEGPYYPNLGLNTPIILTWDTDGAGTLLSLYDGFVTEWPPRWDRTGIDAIVPIQASGVLRRLGQGQPKLKSAIYREILSLSRPTPVAYWPCEDGEDSAEMASAVDGAEPMQIDGQAQLATNEDIAASEPLPTMSGARFVGPVPAYTQTGEFLIRVMYSFPSGGSVNGTQILGFPSSGSASRWAVFYETGGVLRLRVSNQLGVLLEDQAVAFGVDGTRCSFSLEIVRNGLNLDWKMLVVTIGTTSTSSAQSTGTILGETAGHVRNVVVNFNKLGQEIAFGHVVFSTDTTIFAGTDQALVAWTGETAGDRILRLGDEEDIFVEVIGVQADEQQMGPQRATSFLDLIRECEAVDGGVLYESPDEFGLTYRNRGNLYNQAADMTLSVPSGHLSEAPEPTDDDQLIVNDFELSREGGSSARNVNQESADAKGRYEDSATVNAAFDEQLLDIAAWRVHLGTVDEMRWPRIPFDPTRHSELIDPWLALRTQLASRVVVEHEISQLPGIDVDVLMQGWAERIDGHTWAVDLNCAPASPWSVAELADDAEDPIVSGNGRLDTDTSILAEAVDTTQTSFNVSDSEVEWITDSAHWPFDILIGGERMTVTNVAGSGGGGLSDGFEGGVGDWVRSTGLDPLEQSTDFARSGSFSLKAVPDSTQSTVSVRTDFSIALPTAQGNTHVGRCWVLADNLSGGIGPNGVQAALVWFDSGGTIIDQDVGPQSTLAGDETWVEFTVTATADQAAVARVGLRVLANESSMDPADTFYVDDVTIDPPSQTFTVIRSVNDVVKSHPFGESVNVAEPWILVI